jgi:hypothetical protein
MAVFFMASIISASKKNDMSAEEGVMIEEYDLAKMTTA